MANTQTSVPLFVANAVLTAAQQNISAATGTPVFATTVTRDAAFGGSNKALAEGQLCYLESTNVVQQYNGSSWETVGPTSSALTFIKSQAIVAGASTFTMSNAFSATYENYLLTAANLVISGATDQMRVTINGTSGSTYQSSFININFSSSTITGTVASLVSTGVSMGDQTAASTQISANFYSPFLAKATAINGQQSNTTGSRIFSGVDSNAASSTAFTITMATNTFTSGTFYLYGYSIT